MMLIPNKGRIFIMDLNYVKYDNFIKNIKMINRPKFILSSFEYHFLNISLLDERKTLYLENQYSINTKYHRNLNIDPYYSN